MRHVVAFVWIWVTLTSAAYGQVIAIYAGRVVTPSTATVSITQTILVKGDAIRAIEPNGRSPGCGDHRPVEPCRLPGLFDAHTHLAR